MFDSIYLLPNSTATFILTIVFTCIFTLIVIVFLIHINLFVGLTLSQWIDKIRNKTDAASATTLKHIRKHLEILAHDVLKHRFLGLRSLALSIQKAESTHEKLTSEQIDDIREEVFRLCGVRSAPSDRLWQKWWDTFKDIHHLAHHTVLSPIVDPMLKWTSYVMLRLRRMFLLYITRDQAEAFTPETLNKLGLEKCGDVYTKILELTECCGMVIDIQAIVHDALDSLQAQTGRQNAKNYIEIEILAEGKWLCPAASQTLTRCLLRILDNAMSQTSHVLIQAEITQDDLLGQTYLTFRIYDTNAIIPEPVQYGLGLRGVHQEITEFDGGFRFRLEEKGDYRKAAILSVPVTPYKAIAVERVSNWRRVIFILANALSIFFIILTISRIIGGPPVEFAGKGMTVIEFPVEVGHELIIPLCKGGTNVKATLDIDDNAACWEGNCSLYGVLEELKACASGLSSPGCPGELRWTPQFEDGQRLGKSYEITVNCISEGPPRSETTDHIRLLVSRPNKAPEVIQVQIENITSGITTNVNKGPVGVAANDELFLHAVAIDLDSDLIQYTLHMPNGNVLSSFDGIFPIKPEWELFASWNAELEISDNIAPAISIPIQLRATKLHPIALRDISVWHHQTNVFVGCYSITETQHICNFDTAISNDISITAWFDPLLKRIRPKFIFESAETFNYDVKYYPKNEKVPESQIGDQWEFLNTETGQTIAFIELMSIEKTVRPGIYHFVFNSMTNPDYTQSKTKTTNFPISLHITDLSNRLPEYSSFVLFTYNGYGRSEASFVSKHIKLKEYDSDEYASEGKTFTTFYSTNKDRVLKPSFGKFSCSHAAFESAFDPIGFKHNSAGWRIDFRLKRGCIPGLTSRLDSRDRLCSLEVFTDAEKTYSETIWITLEDRACAPIIDHLELVSTPEELAQNDFKWQFRILDSDGDLKPEKIEFSGNNDFGLLIEPDQTYPGSAYRGIFKTQGECLKTQEEYTLFAQDDTGLSVKRRITLPLTCPPLIHLENDAHEVHIDEGQELKLPLKYENDVTPHLTSSIGRIEKGVFIWKATCHHGEAPIHVSITGESKTRIGAPLNFDIYVQHCFPKFVLQTDSDIHDTSQLVIPNGQSKTLNISNTQGNLGQYIYDGHLEYDTPNITITSDLSDTWKLTIQCHDDVSENILWLNAQPGDGLTENFPYHEPQKLHIRCVPQ